MNSQESLESRGSTPVLTLAGVSALLASACCVLPLWFAVIGISGAWISQLRALKPYSNALMIVALVSLGLAAWRIDWAGPQQNPSCNSAAEACSKRNSTARRWFYWVALFTLIPLLVPLAAPMFY